MEFERTYSFNGKMYTVLGNNKLHSCLSNDPKFVKAYLSEIEPDDEETVEMEIGNLDDISFADFKWTPKITLMFLKEYSALKESFRDPKIKKRNLWAQIQSSLAEKGYNMSIDGLDRKFRNLKKTYRTVAENYKKNTRRKITWEFFKILSDIFYDDSDFIPYDVDSLLPYGPHKSGSGSQSTSEFLDVASEFPKYSTQLEEEYILPSEQCIRISNPLSTAQTSDKEDKVNDVIQIRKRYLDMEEKKLHELKKLRLAADRHNTIQQERNDILKEFIKQLS